MLTGWSRRLCFDGSRNSPSESELSEIRPRTRFRMTSTDGDGGTESLSRCVEDSVFKGERSNWSSLFSGNGKNRCLLGRRTAKAGLATETSRREFCVWEKRVRFFVAFIGLDGSIWLFRMEMPPLADPTLSRRWSSATASGSTSSGSSRSSGSKLDVDGVNI